MDFKSTDIATATIITDLNSADAAVALEAAATLAATLQSGGVLLPTADGQLVLPAGVGLDDIKVSGRDLIIQMPDGTQMVVPDGAIFVPQIVIDGVAVPPLNIAALLIGLEPQPAAGRPQSSGGNFADPVGDIGDPFDLGDLLPPTQLAFPEPEEREIIPGLIDEEPDVFIVTPDQPAGSVNATASVDEAALPARGEEPSGSNPSSNAETTTGTIVFDAPDGLGSITLNGTVITNVGQTIVTPLGTLTITSIDAGSIGYSYTLTDNSTAAAPTDIFTVVVTDRDGDTAQANLTISIADDAPTARNDTDGVAAGTYTAQTGNVITGVGTTSGAAGVDTQGADGAAVSGVRAGTETGTFSGVGTTINGQYGTLTIAADGSYTYTRNAGTPGGVNDVFTYQLTDGDGDNSTATLTIAIGDSPAIITFIPIVGEGTIVSEIGLPPRGTEPSGSDPALPIESTSGTITYVALDGPATVQINGVTITAPGQTITTPTGILTITSVAPGVIGYTFTLTDNTSGNNTTQTFTVTVTDVDGDAASAPLVITIIDDAPTARDDAATQTIENAPITVDVFANDTQGADGVSLTSGVALVAGSLSGAGSLAYNDNGTFTYTPAPGEQGTVTFQYSITDGDGDVSTATATITLLRDSVPTVDVAGDSDVAESGLPARGEEPAGSDSEANSEVANGTIATSTGGDSIASLIINGTNVTAGGTVTTAIGTLVITLSEGAYSYSYTLNDNTSGDATTDSFTVTLTDSDGDVATDMLVIAVADDVPTAIADTDNVAAGSYAPATGNVVTDSEEDGGKDVQGADGVTVTNVTGFGGSGAAGTAVDGQYGVLTINADGSYSYVRNAGTAGGVSDVFSYTITDGDGDTSTTTLTISIADSPTSLDLPVEGEAGTSVNEAGLPTGSDAASNSETTAGTINYVAPDGPATVTIDGVAVASVGQAFAGAFGTITITSIANGAIGYSYTLTTNTSGDATFDDFAVVVTDQDGDNTPGTLVIDIVDDVPTARADVDSVTEDDFSGETETPTADGNVITGVGGSDANATDGIADTKGADGAAVTAVAFGATAGAVGGITAGAYGQLTLNADGSYSYVLNNSNPLVQGLDGNDTLSEVFTYMLTDGDGDVRTTTLTITINGSDDPITISGLNVEGPDLIVDEDDLSDGSDTTKEPLTQTGTFTVNGADGISSIKIEGGEAVVGQAFTTAHGTFTITSIVTNTIVGGDPTSITVGYSYQLTDNTAHANANGENFLTELFDIDVTDTDGSTDTATIEVRIIDDVPTAVNDIVGQITENTAFSFDVFGNDTFGADGVDTTDVTPPAGVTFTQPPVGQGTVSYNPANGLFTFTPAAGQQGSTSFTYTIIDRDGDPSTATVTVNLQIDSTPVTVNVVAAVDDDGLAGNNPASTAGDINANAGEPGATASEAIYTGQLTVNFGGDTGTVSFANLHNTVGSVGTETVTYTWSGTTLTATVNAGARTGTVLYTVSLSPSGAYTVTLIDNVLHASGGNDETSAPVVDLNYLATDSDSDSSTTGKLSITFNDDAPSAVADGPVVQGTENVAFTINALSNDALGADGVNIDDAAKVFVSTQATQGVVTYSTTTHLFTYTPNAGAGSTGTSDSFQYTIIDADGDASVATVTITLLADSVPQVVNVVAAVDDDGLAGNNPASTAGDINANAGEPGATASEAIYTGQLTVNFGGDTGTVSFANLHNTVGSVGTETVTYTWSGTTLTATVNAGARTGTVLYTVSLSPSGAYTVTLIDNVLHASGGNDETSAPVVDLNYLATDSDSDSSTTGKLSITFNDDAPSAVADGPVVQGTENVAFTINALSNDALGADGVNIDDAAKVFVSTQATQGVVTYSTTTHLFTYTPNAGAGSTGTSDSFQYTIIDADGDASVATVTITLLADSVPQVVNVVAAVDDDGLTGNNPASTAGDINANAGEPGATASEAIYTGQLTVNFGGDTGTVSFANLHNTVGSVGTETVTYTWSGTTLTATVNAGARTGTVLYTVSLSPSGAYTVTLIDNVLHASGGNDETSAPVVDLNYLATDSDSDSSTTGKLSITFNDDAPSAVADGPVVQGTENVAFTINALSNDALGADGVNIDDAAKVFVSTQATQGVVTYSTTTHLFTYTPNAGAGSTGTSDSFQYTIIDADGDASVATVTITLLADSVPQVVNVVAAVDDDGLTGNNPASTAGDINANAGEPGATASEAIYTGQLTVNFGGDTGTVSFANLHNTVGSVGTETVTYTWSGTTLTATVNAGARTGTVLYTVSLSPSGAYTVTLLDNVLHASGGNDETSAPVVDLNYLATDSDSDSSTTGKLSITFNDDAPTLGVIQNGTANNLPGSAVSVGTLHFTDGADDTGPVGTISLTTAGITSGGKNIVTEQVGNVLTGYADVDNSGTKNVGDTAVFTLTVNPSAGTSGQYEFDLIAPLDGVTVNTPIGGTTSFGSGPAPYQVVSATNVATDPLAIITGWQTNGSFNAAAWFAGSAVYPVTGVILANVNGSTAGWGVDNNNFTTGEFIRWDFGTPIDDFDGAGGYAPPSPALPAVSYASFELIGYTGGDTIQFVVHYTDGTSSNATVTGAALALPLTLTAPVGKFIDWIDTYAPSAGNGKIDITAVGVQQTTVDRTLGFTVTLNDGDGDAVTGSFTVNVKDGNVPSTAAAPIVLDLDGDGLEFVTAAAGVAFDYNGDGKAEPTSWVGSDDGLLAIDLNGDGRINNGSEIVFGSGGQTDLQGLAAKYDSNRDGVLDANDASFGQFAVWQDANGNGVSDAGEVRSLSDAGIVSLNLTSDGNAYVTANGEVDVHGETTFTRADGSTGIAGDVSFAIGGAIAVRSADQIRSGNLTTSIVAAALVGLALDENPAAAHDGGNDMPGHVLGENGPVADSFNPVVIADLRDNPVQSAFAPSHDFVQRIGEIDTSLRAIDEPDFFAGIHDAPLSQMSELLADSTAPQTPNMPSTAFAFGGDSVMHSMLDIAAFTPSIAGNDNPAIPMPVEDAVRGAMPDMMIDRLIDSFTGDLGQPANDSHGGGIDGNDLLVGVLDQNIDAFHVSNITNADFFGSHQYDLATTNN